MKKQFFAFVMLCMYILGSLGGIGVVLYKKEYVIAVGVAAVIWMAFPKVKSFYKMIID